MPSPRLIGIVGLLCWCEKTSEVEIAPARKTGGAAPAPKPHRRPPTESPDKPVRAGTPVSDLSTKILSRRDKAGEAMAKPKESIQWYFFFQEKIMSSIAPLCICTVPCCCCP